MEQADTELLPFKPLTVVHIKFMQQNKTSFPFPYRAHRAAANTLFTQNALRFIHYRGAKTLLDQCALGAHPHRRAGVVLRTTRGVYDNRHNHSPVHIIAYSIAAGMHAVCNAVTFEQYGTVFVCCFPN